MAHIVLLKIAAMFLVIVAGWVARRRGFLAAEFTATLSRLAIFFLIQRLGWQRLTSDSDQSGG